ncbi:hypothetical protein ACIOJE_39225 [Kitasatospora sp. NPDC087861]
MIHTRIAKAAAVATVCLTAIILAPSAAMAATTAAPAPAAVAESLGWGG